MRFQLRRRDVGSPAPASALFVPGRDAAALLSVCTRLGLDPSGHVHDLACGFLLKLDPPTSEPVPGATRLRELGTDLFVPVDAELVPSLLDDEAAGLVRDGGLVFLPGGRLLRFDRTSPVGMEAILVAAPRPRREWRSLPETHRLADRVVEIAREWPEPPPEQLYREWEQDLRRPGPGRRGSRRQGAAGQEEGGIDEGAEAPGGEEAGAAGGLMPGLHGLGDALRDLAGRAGAGARSFGEQVGWGMLDHSSLVQKLLREFREGDPGRALRHAFPMTPADPRDRTVGWGSQLPWNRAIYNLFDLLGSSSRGRPVGTWQARSDLMDELGREYRKAAERAIQQGDYRRAAYIYGKLLGDHRLAAQALQRGGLHHDAAILYLRKVNDRAAAAQAFEAAGQVDRAIEIYRQVGGHEAAGDLLRRLGEEEGAVREYVLAVERAVDSEPPDWYVAGCMLLHKARLPEPAMQAFRQGWDRRPEANAAACALELTWNHAVRGEIEPIRELLDEADGFFKSVGSLRDAESFYNRMAVLASAAPALAPFAEEVHDRAVLALAHHLRCQVESGFPAAAAVSGLFGEPALWTPAFIRDARFAASAAARSRDRTASDGGRPRSQGVQVGRGTVTAACQAAATSEVFLGFADGKILAFRPGRNQVVPVGGVQGAVASMAADPDGEVVVALSHTEHGAVLTAFARRPDGSFRPQPDTHFPMFTRSWLTPILRDGTNALIGVGDGREPALVVLDAVSGLVRARVSVAADVPPAMALLVPEGDAIRVVTYDGPRWLLVDAERGPIGRSKTLWRPVGSSRNPRCSVPLNVLCHEGTVKVIGLDEHGAVYSTHLYVEDRVFELLSSYVATTAGGYVAAAPAAPDKVVAVSESRIDWLGYGSDRFQLVRTLEDPGLAATVACFPSTAPNEILVVSASGFVARIEAPRRASTSKGIA
jgi:tetratricopeptide (TPR) repeat protein